ncbi:MAG TPA: hypothetical protein VFV43_06165 [Limnobacter sp.]|nr:hypothetical protein [Limnobacter sp.]
MNRPLLVAGKHVDRTARFSLLDLLQHLNIPQATLKGSMVHRWKSDATPQDIDLQLPLSNPDQTTQIIEKLQQFLNAKSGATSGTAESITHKTWFFKVAHHMQGAWTRLILNVGYPKTNATTLDLNFTNKPSLAHDTIHASKGLQFDWTRRKAFVVDSWHPKLVDWLTKNQLLWFNEDIDDGLGRLSYRLSKAKQARLLQPDLAAKLFSCASEEGIANVYLRVLLNEYPNGRLQNNERISLWQPLINAAKSEQYSALQAEMLAWSQFKSIEQLEAAIMEPESLPIVLDRLTNACRIGINFKTEIRDLLNNNNRITRQLAANIEQSLGVELIAPDCFFEMIDAWANIAEIPEQELQNVLGDYLGQLTKSNNPEHATRATHILGWLAGDEIHSLHFWLDRNQFGVETAQVIEAVTQVIKKHGVTGLCTAMPKLAQLRISHEGWTTLANTISEHAEMKSDVPDGTTDCTSFEFLRLLCENSVVLKSMLPGAHVALTHSPEPLPTSRLHHQLVAFAERLQGAKVPPLLRGVLSQTPNGLEIELPDMKIHVNHAQSNTTITTARCKHWITEHCYGSQQTQANTSPLLFRMLWKDGTLFTGSPGGSSNSTLQGTLTCMNYASEPGGLQGLLCAGRSLCISLLPGSSPELNHWCAKGIFNAQQLMKSEGLSQALLALKEGNVVDQALNPGLRIEHVIQNHQPQACKVHIPDPRGNTCLQMRYERKSSSTDDEASEFQNPWNVVPVEGDVQSHGVLNIPPYGSVQLSSSLPWHSKEHSLCGWAEVIGTGPLPFRWKGKVAGGQLLPFGCLHLEKQKEPAIVFDALENSDPIPVTLLPVMADLLGKKRHGYYNFVPRVWNHPSEWPPAGFEGFIHQYPCTDGHFSGYITATGRAIGTLSQAARTPQNHHKAWTGAFQVQDASVFTNQPVTIDHQDQNAWGVILAEGKYLAPHGLIREHFINPADQQVFAKIDKIYFGGQGMSYNQITQKRDLLYHSPNLTSYLVGTGYSVDKVAKHLDMVFNAGDGGHDFMVLKPQHYDREMNYQEIYRDSKGMHATLLVVDNQYRMGHIRFPSGVAYSGQIARRGNYLCLQGKGKITLGTLSFSAEFGANSEVKHIRGLNPESEQWVNAYTPACQQTGFTAPQWIELISGGQVGWQADLQAHLLIRNLSQLKKDAIVFSRT